MYLRIALMLVFGSVVSCASPPQEEPSMVNAADAQLRSLYESEWDWRQRENARQQTDSGDWEPSDRWPEVDEAAQSRRLAYWREALTTLADIDRSKLSAEEAINAAVFEQIIETLVSDVEFKAYEAPLNSDTFFWSRLHPRNRGFASYDAYLRYFDRISDIPRYFADQQQNMRAGMARGYTVPAVSLKGRDGSIEAYLRSGQDNPFWAPLESLPPTVTDAQREELQAMALRLISEQVVPTYQELLDFLREEYFPAARQTIAARDLPNGDEFYQAQIRKHTTLALTPEAIYETGLDEVARIRRAQEAILKELEYSGTMEEFFEFLRTDPRFYAKTPDELMGYSSYVAKRMDGKLAEVLSFLPRRRFSISPVPDEIAPIYTSGRGGLNGCLMNTYNLPARPLYSIPALTLHECAPGHALQFAIAVEAPGEIPEFRAQNYFSGYGEGWGLYTEWLGGEIGIYRTPYERFGQLTFEMWRACRLVIDTGLHQFGWSRQRAIDYLTEHAALSAHDIETEIDRYISWPAQALSYKLGEIMLREKRTLAEERLGVNFDQRYFHDKILSLRSVPLTVLDTELDAWIAAGGPDPYAGEEIN